MTVIAGVVAFVPASVRRTGSVWRRTAAVGLIRASPRGERRISGWRATFSFARLVPLNLGILTEM
jgi:hypothetical protein